MIVAAGRLRAHVSLKPDVPSEIAVPAGNKIFLVAHTKDGVQIYKCTATPNGATPFS